MIFASIHMQDYSTQPQALNKPIIKMRREALFIDTPMPKGCISCKYVLRQPSQLGSLTETNRKRHLRCDERKPACKRCINSGRTCEGYVCVSLARKPTDVTPESIIEFRQKCLPSREHPKKALVVMPVNNLPTPKAFYSFATVSSGSATPDDFMHHILRVVLSHPIQRGKDAAKSKRDEREMDLIKFHEPVKDSFDMSKPEGCPALRSAFLVQMYRVMMDILMSKGHTSDNALHGLMVENSLGRRK